MLPDITTIPLMQLASGDRLSLQLYKFVGLQPGKKVYIQSNLHGCELMGNPVIYQLIKWLRGLEPQHLAGEVWLVPMCNPVGVNQRSHHFATGRFSPYDGKDWNRIFWDYEKETADLLAFAESQKDLEPAVIQRNFRQRMGDRFQQLGQALQSPMGLTFNDRFRYLLQSLSLDADYVIDLHTSSNQGLEFVYYFRDRDDAAPLFLFDTAILLDEYDGDAFDEAFIKPWLALERYLGILGRSVRFDIEAWTLELGSGMAINPESVRRGVNGVINYLCHKGVVNGVANGEVTEAGILSEGAIATRFTASSKMHRYYATTGGILQWRRSLGTTAQVGEPLYQMLCFNKDGNLPERVEVNAAQSGLILDVSTNHAVNEGDYILTMI